MKMVEVSDHRCESFGDCPECALYANSSSVLRNATATRSSRPPLCQNQEDFVVHRYSTAVYTAKRYSFDIFDQETGECGGTLQWNISMAGIMSQCCTLQKILNRRRL